MTERILKSSISVLEAFSDVRNNKCPCPRSAAGQRRSRLGTATDGRPDRTAGERLYPALPWQVNDAPRDFIERLIQQVVGMEIPISRWAGKWKVSQNQPVCNRDSVVAHLEQQKQPDSEAMAEYVLAGLKDGKRGHPG